MYRDVSKVLFTRNIYTGSNEAIKSRPDIHASAIAKGFESEKVSSLIESILWRRVENPIEDEKLLSVASNYYKYRLTESDDKGYEHEFTINNRVGVGLSDYYQMCIHSKLYITVPRFTTINPVAKLLVKYRLLMDENGKPLGKRRRLALDYTIPQDFLTREGTVKKGTELIDALWRRIVLASQ